MEASLAVISVLGLAVAAWRGAFARQPVMGPAEEPSETSSYELALRVDELRREARRQEHRARQLSRGDPARERLMTESRRQRDEAEQLLRAREEELARISS